MSARAGGHSPRRRTRRTSRMSRRESPPASSPSQSNPERESPMPTDSALTADRRWLVAPPALLDRTEATPPEPIERAAELFATTIAADGLVHVFGSGHS